MCNGKGLAEPSAVARLVRQGCSVQVVHPQRFCPQVAKLLAKLEARTEGELPGAFSRGLLRELVGLQ